MALFESFSISSSGMTANRLWLDTISNNIANMNSTGRPGDPAQQPYRRQTPVFSAAVQQYLLNKNPGRGGPKTAGVKVTGILHDGAPPQLVHDPSHPHADPETGYVAYPNINVLNEMVNMLTATRAYEANVTALNSAKEMALAALEIGR
ncbi:MAG: flagellar basal body rod protein FlgC [Bacillota bacterium]|jgi:flagellar basal-body rod protein FlgC